MVVNNLSRAMLESSSDDLSLVELMKLRACQDSEADFDQNCCKKLLYDLEAVTLGPLCIWRP